MKMKLPVWALLAWALFVGHAMADSTVSSMTAATTPLSGAELIYCVQGGADRKCLASSIGGASYTQGAGITIGGGAISLGDADLTYSSGIMTLGAAGSVVGELALDNATSGSITLAPTTGALGTVTATLPANSGTIAELNLAQTWTAGQTFTNGDLLLKGSSSGALTLEAPTAASAYIATLPANTGTLAELNLAQTFTAIQTVTNTNSFIMDGGLATIGSYSANNEGLALYASTGNTEETTWNQFGIKFLNTSAIVGFGGLTSDTSLSRLSAGIVAIGSGSGGSVAGGVETAVFISASTKPTLTTGSCSGTAAAGGATAGTFTAASCVAGTYTLSAMPTAPTGYSCDAQDRTTSSDAIQQTASSATSATFTATTAAFDVIQFKCIAY